MNEKIINLGHERAREAYINKMLKENKNYSREELSDRFDEFCEKRGPEYVKRMDEHYLNKSYQGSKVPKETSIKSKKKAVALFAALAITAGSITVLGACQNSAKPKEKAPIETQLPETKGSEEIFTYSRMEEKLTRQEMLTQWKEEFVKKYNQTEVGKTKITVQGIEVREKPWWKTKEGELIDPEHNDLKSEYKDQKVIVVKDVETGEYLDYCRMPSDSTDELESNMGFLDIDLAKGFRAYVQYDNCIENVESAETTDKCYKNYQNAMKKVKENNMQNIIDTQEEERE